MPAEATTTPDAEVPVNAPDLTPEVHGPQTPPAAKADKVDVPPPADPKPTKEPNKDAVTAPPAGGVEALLEQLKNLPVSQVDMLLDAIERETGTQRGKNEASDDDAEVPIDESSVSRKTPVRYTEVEPGMQKAIAAVHNHMIGQAVAQVLDSDKELSYNMSVLGPKARDSVVAILKDQMDKQIAKEGARFDYDWDRVAQIAFQKAQPVVAPFFDRPTPRAGMGPGGVASLGRELQEPKRVPAYADQEDWATYIQNKMQYEQQRAEREAQVPGL